MTKPRTSEYPKTRQDIGKVDIGDYTLINELITQTLGGELTGGAGGLLQDGRGVRAFEV